jgi:hypothetical protein
VINDYTDDDKCAEGCVKVPMFGEAPRKCWFPPRRVKFDGINALMPRDPDCTLDESPKYSKKGKNWHVSNGFHSVPDAALKAYPEPEEW